MTNHVYKCLARLRSESGMTLAEVMIASLVLAFSSLAVLNLIASGARTNYRAEQSQVVADRLQSEMEKVKQLADTTNYTRIALSQAPSHSDDVNDPAYRVSGTTYNVAPNGNSFQTMVIDAGGLPPVNSFASGDVHGTIHRFVTWEPDSACTDCKKRVIVAIQLDATASGGVRHYQELQSVIADPRAPARDNPIPPPPDQPKPWTFWLTDTPCNNADRQPLTGNHLSHNTRATCDKGLKTADNCTTVLLTTTCTGGAPDLMVTHPPQNSTPEPLYNFATDVIDQSPSQDQGLRLLRPAASGCPTLDAPLVSDVTNPYRFREIHKWVSAPMPSGFNVQLDGNGTVNLWTRTVGNQPYSGAICVWLFQRQLNLLGVAVDTPAVNLYAGSPPQGSCIQPGALNLTYFKCSLTSWPSGPQWHEITIPLHFTLNVLAPNSQLGLAIQVERAGTNGGGLQFYYDEPSYESRLEVHSSSLLPSL
jgi:type II secretory pathway pseudopilin PulG